MLLAGAPAHAEKSLLRAAAAATRKQPRPGTSSKTANPPPAAAERAQRLGLGRFQTAAKLLQGRPDPAWVSATGAEGWNGTLRFPVPGAYVTRGFGSGKAGYHQAIDIAADLGSKVRAAAGGLVGYAGNQVPGYGNMVMLIHPGGFVTMYAHNQKNLVFAGQRVRRNAVIAELGSTGRSMGPHVHFELLWNGQNCDAAPLFRPAALRKNGSAFQPQQSAWKQPHKKPKLLRCGVRKHHPDYAPNGAPAQVDVDADDDG
jgi:murein DD-endopeptidase MepM/ murein hydrolase activator NlpD